MTQTVDIPVELHDWVKRAQQRTVEATSVRYFVDAIEDTNPLFRDPRFAQEHGYRAQLAPPTMLDLFKPFYIEADYPYRPDLPYSLSAADHYEFVRPVCVGDVLVAETRLTGIRERQRADGGTMVFVEYENSFADLAGEVVARETWTGAYFGGNPTANLPVPLPEPAPGSFEVPAAQVHTTRVALARWAGAVGDWERIHIDEPYARQEMHLPSVVGHGTRTGALLARTLTDWAGPDGFVRSFSVTYRAVSVPGELLSGRAWLRAAGSTEDGRDRYDAQLAVVDQHGKVLTLGSAVVEVPAGSRRG